MATRRRTSTPPQSPAAVQSVEPASPRRRASRKPAAPPAVTVTAESLPPAAVAHAVPEAVRRAMIAESAYLRAERRGFAAGGEVEDWLAAEAEVDALLKAGHGGTPQ